MIARNRATAVLILMVAALWMGAAAPVPRPAGDLPLSAPPAKPAISLPALKGKVVVVEFLLTHCPHCWRLAQTLDKLRKELDPNGFTPVAVAFDNDVNGPLVADFVTRSRITFPVGFTSADKVDAFLGRGAADRMQVPQLVVIDRAGVIRAQSLPKGEANLEDEAYLRKLITGMLKEEAPPQAGK